MFNVPMQSYLIVFRYFDRYYFRTESFLFRQRPASTAARERQAAFISQFYLHMRGTLLDPSFDKIMYPSDFSTYAGLYILASGI